MVMGSSNAPPEREISPPVDSVRFHTLTRPSYASTNRFARSCLAISTTPYRNFAMSPNRGSPSRRGCVVGYECAEDLAGAVEQSGERGWEFEE